MIPDWPRNPLLEGGKGAKYPTGPRPGSTAATPLPHCTRHGCGYPWPLSAGARKGGKACFRIRMNGSAAHSPDHNRRDAGGGIPVHHRKAARGRGGPAGDDRPAGAGRAQRAGGAVGLFQPGHGDGGLHVRAQRRAQGQWRPGGDRRAAVTHPLALAVPAGDAGAGGQRGRFHQQHRHGGGVPAAGAGGHGGQRLGAVEVPDPAVLHLADGGRVHPDRHLHQPAG